MLIGFTGTMPFRLSNLLLRTSLWNSTIRVESAGWRIGDPLSAPAHRFNTKRLLRRRGDVVHRADPFLHAREDGLYLFMEAQAEGAPGRIEAWKSADLAGWEFLGDVLVEPFHLSYPFVFEDGGATYMVPESASGGGVFLYEFESFPDRPVRRRTLLEGEYLDSNLLRWNGRWYLFTESPDGLEIFHADDFRTGRFEAHPLNPITGDPRYRRCGGGAIEHHGALIRLAQDCSTSYGSNLHAMLIEELSPHTYRERVLRHDLFDRTDPWNKLGAHHLSLAAFAGRTVVAADGLRHDYYLHRALDLAERGLKAAWARAARRGARR